MKYARGRAARPRPSCRAKYINDRHLPDKAIDVIDEAGAAQRILPKANKQKKIIGKTEVEEIVAKIARIPAGATSRNDDRSALQNARARPEERGVRPGQGDRRAGLGRSRWRARASAIRDKPIGNFLFSGPTGVGKTEVGASSSPTAWASS